MSYDSHLLENRGDFKLHAAKKDILKQLEDASPGKTWHHPRLQQNFKNY